MKYVMSVDLGQAADWTAYTLIRRYEEYRFLGPPRSDISERARPRFSVSMYNLVDIRRPPLGTPYTDIVEDLKVKLKHPQLMGNCELLVDATGVGRPVLDIMTAAGLSPQGIVVTGGHDATMGPDGMWRVPKRQLVSASQIVLQGGRIAIAELELGPILETELRRFTMKIVGAGAETYEAWRDRDHDDIVLSLAMSLWYQEQMYGSVSEVGTRAQKSPSEYDPLRH